MVWEIKVCRKCIKNLMSSSETSVFPATKREAVTNCGSSGVSREEGGTSTEWRGMWRLHLDEREVWSVLWSVGAGSVVPAREPRYAVSELCWARSWCWQIINNGNDYESTVHVPLGLCKKTFTSKSNRNVSPLV